MKPFSCEVGHQLCRVDGLYVTDRPEGLKIGRSRDLRQRLVHHRKLGATRAWAYPAPQFGPFPFPRTLPDLERTALHLVVIYGGRPQPYATEIFTGISYDDAAEAVQDVCAPHGVRKVAINLENDLDTTSCSASVHARGFKKTRAYREVRALNIPLARLTEEPKP